MERVNEIDDRWPRRLGIVGFGLSIPHLTGLLRGVSVVEPRYWFGMVWFVLLAAAIWHGNRWLLFRQRERLDWFTRPVGKVVFLISGCVFFTAPITAAAVIAWYRGAGLGPVDGDVLGRVVLTNVISVLFVTHIYETAFLVKARHRDKSTVERLSRLRAEAELAALRAQIDPHVLFNALNTLNWLIERDPARATEYTGRLADVYRYILANRERELVTLREEVEFVEAYFHLHAVRFGAALELVRPNPADPWLDQRLVVPISIQPLVENAIKHNVFSEREPLRIEVRLDEAGVTVSNPVRRRSVSRAADRAAGVGLRNLRERLRVSAGQSLAVTDDGEWFCVQFGWVAAEAKP